MKCELCGAEEPDEGVALAKIIDHLRVIHPEVYGDGPERWPDGEVVVHDETLDPGDFGGVA